MTLSELQLRRLSPGALRLYQRQLPQRLQEMGELERNTLLEQLSRMPEFATMFQEPEPREKGWWEYPLEWMRTVEKGAGTLLGAWSTPSVASTEEMGWWEREKAEYEQWEAPSMGLGFNLPGWMGGGEATIGIKGALELTPWFATAIATGGLAGIGRLATVPGLGMLARVAQVGTKAIRPIVATERAVMLAPFKVVGEVAKPIMKPIVRGLLPSQLPQTSRFVAPAVELLERQITQTDWQRRIAQMFGRKPFLKSITEKLGGRAATVTEAVEDTTARALLIGARTQDILLSKTSVALASLRKIHTNPVRLFGVDEATGLTKIRARAGVGKVSKHINDIAEHPERYVLTKQQKSYIDQVHGVEDWVLDGLRQAGVDVKLLKFDEFSHWVHREVIGKNIDDALTKIYPKGGKKIGAKASWEKTRFYEEAAEGVKNGILYEGSLERVVELYAQTAGKRIADQRIAKMVEVFGKTALERAQAMAPEVLVAATKTAYTLSGAKQLSKVIQRALRGEKLPEVTLRAMEKRFPEIVLRGATPDKLKSLAKQAKSLEEAAKAPYWKARARRAVLMEKAKTPTMGTESTIWHPAFQGRIYPKNVAGEITKYWDDMGWGPLGKLATMSGEMRTLVAAADFSAPFIQGLPAIGKYPIGFGKNVAGMFKAFAKPETYQNFLTKNWDEFMEMSHYSGYVGGFEFMEAMPQLQKTAAMVTRLAAGKPQIGSGIIRQTYGRFESAFGFFGDAMRLHIWKALKASVKSPDELMELGRHINRMTGVMSSKGLGLGATQRQFEQAFVFFAPRYTRAGFALVSDIFKGGLTGSQARKALGSMMAAGASAYVGISLALGQEPNFDPTNGRFMTIEINDPVTGEIRHFGIGGMMTSLIRLGADISASLVGAGQNEPLDFVKLNRFDNPFMRFMFSKSAPLTGFMEGLVFGHNYFGEPFENTGDYATFLIEQVTPIAAQETILGEEGFAFTALGAEMLGARVFPRSDWEERDVKRDEISQETYGMSWEEVGERMGRLYQEKMLRDNPDLQELTEIASETSSKMARGEGKVWDMWKKEGRAIEETYRQAVILASMEFEATGDGTTFREKVDDAHDDKREMYAFRERDPQFTEVYDYFNEPLEPDVLAKMNPLDIARKEYYLMMYSEDMYDQFGNYRFEEADKRESYFVQKYGQKALDYVEEYMGAKWIEPPALEALREARRILEPYWNIETQIWAQYPPELKQIADQIKIIERTDPLRAKRMLFQYPQIVMARRIIALYKKQMKMRSPQMALALNTYYRY